MVQYGKHDAVERIHTEGILGNLRGWYVLRCRCVVAKARSSNYSEWNIDDKWSSQVLKSDELMEDWTGRPFVFAQHTYRFAVENDNMDSYAEAESEMSLKSRSFLHSVNDQVQKRQKQSSIDGSKKGETRIWQVCHRWWYGLWHRHRIQPFSKIMIILEQGEWPIAKDIGPDQLSKTAGSARCLFLGHKLLRGGRRRG